MSSLEQVQRQAANLYWLAFLLTGDRDASVDAALEGVESPDSSPFFLGWMLAWSRKVVIAKALAAVRRDLSASAERIAVMRTPRSVSLPSRNWALPPGATKRELERALLAIDAFPRCVLLLLLFEGVSVEDAAVLLDADRDLVLKAQEFALRELTRNLEVSHARA